LNKTSQCGWRFAIKMLCDRFIAAIALVLLSPLMAILAFLVRLSMGQPVLFRQQRPGKSALPFTVFKFSTMSQMRGPDGMLLPDADRLTALGRFLRTASLDELPQLWNVLRGEMSLVGPRPLMMNYLERYTPEQARRHEVLPGITGWAQVKGRNSLSWEQRLQLDIWYVDHWSLWFDLKILVLTIFKVLSRDDIAYPGHATMAEFTGTGKQ
jgi:sugar transferase EpsL